MDKEQKTVRYIWGSAADSSLGLYRLYTAGMVFLPEKSFLYKLLVYIQGIGNHCICVVILARWDSRAAGQTAYGE